MATAASIQKNAISTLTATYKSMTTEDFLVLLEDESKAVQKDAGIKLIRTHFALVKLQNAELSDLSDQLTAHEADLKSATQALQQELNNMTTVSAVLNTVGDLLSVIAEIIPLIAG